MPKFPKVNERRSSYIVTTPFDAIPFDEQSFSLDQEFYEHPEVFGIGTSIWVDLDAEYFWVDTIIVVFWAKDRLFYVAKGVLAGSLGDIS
jgi:hypothetical protein